MRRPRKGPFFFDQPDNCKRLRHISFARMAARKLLRITALDTLPVCRLRSEQKPPTFADRSSGDEFFGHGTASNSVALKTKTQAERSCLGSRIQFGVHRCNLIPFCEAG